MHTIPQPIAGCKMFYDVPQELELSFIDDFNLVRAFRMMHSIDDRWYLRKIEQPKRWFREQPPLYALYFKNNPEDNAEVTPTGFAESGRSSTHVSRDIMLNHINGFLNGYAICDKHHQEIGQIFTEFNKAMPYTKLSELCDKIKENNEKRNQIYDN